MLRTIGMIINRIGFALILVSVLIADSDSIAIPFTTMTAAFLMIGIGNILENSNAGKECQD